MGESFSQLGPALRTVDALLPEEVYEALYRLACEESPRVIVEIGTAHGAATIALAWGCQQSGRDTTIHTVDCFVSSDSVPSSRTKFGDSEKNKQIVLENFTRTGVAENITLFVGTSEEFAMQAELAEGIDILVLDADGRIDRDLLLFGPHLVDDAVVVIDDIDGRPHVVRSHSNGSLLTDLKHVASRSLLNAFTQGGYLRITHVVGSTAFCRAQSPSTWDAAEMTALALSSYRELVFTPFVGKPRTSFPGQVAKVVRRMPWSHYLFPVLQRYWRSVNRRVRSPRAAAVL